MDRVSDPTLLGAALHADLTIGPTPRDLDRLVCYLAQVMRQARCRTQIFLQQDPNPLLDKELLLDIRDVCDECEVLMDQFNRGAVEADRIDEAIRDAERGRIELIEKNEEDLIFLGSSERPTSYSVMGWDCLSRRLVALSRDGGHVILAAGIPGVGKTRSGLGLIEASLEPCAGITSSFLFPTAAIAFHLDPTGARLHDFLAGLSKNTKDWDLEMLARHLGVAAAPIGRMNFVVPSWLFDEYKVRLAPFIEKGLNLLPLRLRLPEIGQSGLEVALGGSIDTFYARHILDQAQSLGDRLTLPAWRQLIENDKVLNAAQKRAAAGGLSLLSKVESQIGSVWDLVGPGVLTIFSLSGRWIGTGDSLPLQIILMNAIAGLSGRHGAFQRLFELDEINWIERDPKVMAHLLALCRQIRHRGSSIMIMGQDFEWLPDEIMGLATVFMLFRMHGPKLFEHIRERVGGFSGWRFDQIAALLKGQSVVVATEATEPEWRGQGRMLYHRPLRCDFGGHTKAVL